jgi:thioredoxin 1
MPLIKTTSMTVEITDDTFDEVITSNKPVMIDFWAGWCAPCKVLAPIIDGVAKDVSGDAIVGKIDADKYMTGGRFGVRNIPTVLIFKDGQVVDRLVGLKQASEYKQALKKVI